MTKSVKITEHLSIGGSHRLVLLAGPCVIESEKMLMETAETLKVISERVGVNLVFKSSFDKANRSSLNSQRGPGLERGLQLLAKVKNELGLPIVTDVHECYQCAPVAEVADILQIPAFLCRQTDLLLAAQATGKAVNVKKGQFLAPDDVQQIIQKFELSGGGSQLMLCERGTTFGYHNLVVDFAGMVQMRNYGTPLVFDATHAVQQPGGNGTSTGGNRQMVPYLMYAAAAIGVDGLFAEVHPDPDCAWSDAANQMKLSGVEDVLKRVVEFDALAKQKNE